LAHLSAEPLVGLKLGFLGQGRERASFQPNPSWV